MKRTMYMAASLMAAALVSGAPLAAAAQGFQTQQTASAQDWSTPPQGTEQEQAAYRDGIQSAKVDKTANRKIDATASYQYVHPPVKKTDRDAYRTSFAAGYNAVVKHNAGS